MAESRNIGAITRFTKSKSTNDRIHVVDGQADAGEREADEQRGGDREHRPRRGHQAHEHHRQEERAAVDRAAEQAPRDLAQ